MAQLTVTVGFIALFVFVSKVSVYSKNHPEMMWTAFALSIVLLIALACFGDFRRRWPLYIILLGLFTICESFMLGTIASFYDVKFNSIFDACVIRLIIIIFVFQISRLSCRVKKSWSQPEYAQLFVFLLPYSVCRPNGTSRFVEDSSSFLSSFCWCSPLWPSACHHTSWIYFMHR